MKRNMRQIREAASESAEFSAARNSRKLIKNCGTIGDSVATIFKKVNQAMLMTGTPVFDAEGELWLVVCNTRDVPELRRMERELQSVKEERAKTHSELVYLRGLQAEGQALFYRSAAIPEELLESEFFGYESGAFTGAKQAGKIGMFELADTGVILLDEIGELPLSLQTKLLRVIQERELIRLGGTRSVKLDLRVIAATNRNLREEVRNGRFREDLYYRLNVVPIELRPLRERKEDIPLLVRKFCEVFRKKYNKTVDISPGGIELLFEYPWPGNIRELENLMERLVVTSSTGSISRGAVFQALNPRGVPFPHIGEAGQTLKGQLQAFDREIVLHTIAQEGSLRKAAKVLGVDHSTLVKKVHAYQSESKR